MGYKKRIIDEELREVSRSNVMISISGVKGCGKTETAKQICKSGITIDRTDGMKKLLSLNPDILSEGGKPRLIDEWQLEPWIWNKIRHAVDNKEGCFFLTGSATPVKDAYMHSGAGRTIRYHMRPMSWYELEYSTGEITLDDILKNTIKTTKLNEIPFKEKLERLVFGGWPFLLESGSYKEKIMRLQEYVKTIYADDLQRVDETNKNWKIGRSLLMSLARNVSTYATVTTLLNDIKIHDSEISKHTFDTYYLALQKIHIIEELEAWPTHLRSSASLRSSAKRYFVDPSLALALLKATPEKLMSDMNFTGFIFENEVVKNLRIYADRIGADLYYYGDMYSTTENGKKIAKSREVDVIMVLSDGNWCAFEIKMGFDERWINEAVSSLNNLMKNIDFTKVRKPLSLNIITCDGFAYKRKEDGINVIPLNVLR